MPTTHHHTLEATSSTLSGGVPSSNPVSFCGGLVCSSAGGAVKVANVATGTAAKSLVPSATAAFVVAIAASKANPFLLYAAHLDGSVNLWDVSDSSLLKSWSFKDNITHFKPDPSNTDSFIIAFQSKKKKGAERKSRIERVVLKLLDDSNSKKDSKKAVLMADFVYDFATLDVSASTIVATSDRFLYVWDAVKLGEPKKISLPKKQQIHSPKITCLAVHPSTHLISIGLSTGEILLYHNPFLPTPPVQILHWHANAVTSLAFMHDGTTLLSGGIESVLVLWQLETLSKKTLPRIAAGNALLSLAVSADDALIGVVCGDASVRVISVSNLSVKTCVTGLKARKGRVLDGGNGVVVDPRTGSVVVAGNIGCIQFYDAVRDVHVMEVEAVAQNRIVVSGGVDKDGVGKVDAEDGLAAVKLVAFEREGRRSKWMATVDERDGMCVGGEVERSLKFWLWDDVTQNYSVNTRVASPHDGPITSIHFFSLPSETDPSQKVLHCITTSLDTRFKTWELTPPPANSRDPTPSWTQKSHGFHKDSPVYDAATSSDASMLAVACGSVVTLWDPSTNSLVATLCHPTGSEHVLKVAFVEGNETPCLVAVTSGRCYVWNLLTGSVWWSVDLGGQALALVVDAHTARFSVSVGVRKSTGKADAAGSDSAVEVDAEVKKVGKIIESRVLEFEAASPVPKMVFAGEGHIQGLQYLNKAQIPVGKGDVARLVILSSKYELLAVGPKAQAAALSSAESSEAVSVSNDDAAGLFSGIYGSTAFQQTPTSLHLEANAQKPETMQTVKELASVEASKLAFMGAASHLLPPPMKLAGAYFDAILKKRDMEEERVERAMYGMTGAVQDEDNNDEEMEETTEVEPVKSKELTAQDLLGFEFLGGVFKKLAIKNEKEAIAAAVPAVTVKDAKVITVTSKSSSPAGKGSAEKPLVLVGKGTSDSPIVIDDDVPVTASKKGKKKKTI